MEEQVVSQEVTQAAKEYQRDVTITQARPLVKQIVFAIWVVFDVALLLLLLVTIGGYVMVGQWQDREAVAGLFVNTALLHEAAQARSAVSLQFEDVKVFSSGETADFFTIVKNPNENWYASFSYTFSGPFGQTQSKRGFVFPGEQRKLVLLSEEVEGSTLGTDVVIIDLQWRRLDGHVIEDYPTWYAQHMDFDISDAQHTMVEVAGKRIARSSFTLTNNSPYSYWSAPFLLFLERNGVPVALNQFTVAGFETGETRAVSIHWFTDVPTSGEISIQPMLDFLDADAYMEQAGESGIDVRDRAF